MSVSFVHFSDIHFGQETGGDVRIHDDVKERLIEDVKCVARRLDTGQATGIIVTGDIAFGGREHEYRDAANWLDKVADAAGCARHRIQIVPGNHDIDRGKITEVTRLVLHGIVTGGDRTLDRVLATEEDRELLFRRFSGYRPFSEGYRCPLNTNAEPEEWVAELAPGRSLRFVRMNSALVCSADDKQGHLLLGKRQRALRPRMGQELVVLCHHPVHWLQDSEDALRFIRSRARVFMSGHEHAPSLAIEEIEEGSDLMMLAAGAAVPRNADQGFTYHYNFVEFDWDVEHDALSVVIRPRVWIDERKKFGVDELLLAKQGDKFVLGCPYYRNSPREDALPSQEVGINQPSDTVLIGDPEQSPSLGDDKVAEEYALVLLRFFRDITGAQRMEVLMSLSALPKNWKEPLNESFERTAFDKLVREGRIDDLRREIAKMTRDHAQHE